MKNPSLPQTLSAMERDKRKADLKKNQTLYVYESPEIIPGISFIKGPVHKLPGQSPSFGWKLKVVVTVAKSLLNFAGFNCRRMFNAARVLGMVMVNQHDSEQVDKALESVVALKDSKALAEEALRRHENALLEESDLQEKSPIFNPYREMYHLLRRPDIADNFLDDRIFARLRVAGYNPMSLFRVRTTGALPFAVDDARMPQAGDTVAAAVAENRLYALDFSFLGDIKQKADSQMLLLPTKALFVVAPGGGGALQPLAVQLERETVYPSQAGAAAGYRWELAKLAVNTGDAVHHELVAHLGRTHLLLEPFVAATMRQLHADHPLHALLAPHFEGTMFINDAAAGILVAPGGNVDRNFGGDLSSLMLWAGQQVLATRFNATMPEVEMRIRGVDDPTLDFPYRDDALAHFAALRDWVAAYLGVYYCTDEDVARDDELQAWAAELTDPARGRVRDFGDDGDGRITSTAYLCRAVSFLIFSASVQHAAVNYPQKLIMTYAPAVPFALFAPLQMRDAQVELSWWREMLTPLQLAIEQVQVLSLLGGVYYTRLGRYRCGALPREAVIRRALRTYKKKLRDIDRRIRDRERGQMLPYEFMRSRNVPQSTNI